MRPHLPRSGSNGSGTRIWATEVDGAVNGYDYPLAIQQDGAGNTYVAGGSYATEFKYRYTLFKLDPAGRLLWNTAYPSDPGAADPGGFPARSH